MTTPPHHTVLLRTLIFVFRGEDLLLMKYSGQGHRQTQEKSDRRDIYNPIGGHIEAGEDILASARREAEEEAGIQLEHAQIRGIINVGGFAGKQLLNFIITGTTTDTPLEQSLEGSLHWIKPAELDGLPVFADIRPILDQLASLQPGQLFTGTAQFEGFDLKHLELTPSD